MINGTFRIYEAYVARIVVYENDLPVESVSTASFKSNPQSKPVTSNVLFTRRSIISIKDRQNDVSFLMILSPSQTTNQPLYNCGFHCFIETISYGI